MKRLFVALLIGTVAVLGTMGSAQARDYGCRSYSSHGHGHSSYRSYSSGYCQPRSYRSYNSYQPRYYQSYNSCQPRYYSAPRCYHGGGISISTPGLSFFFRR